MTTNYGPQGQIYFNVAVGRDIQDLTSVESALLFTQGPGAIIVSPIVNKLDKKPKPIVGQLFPLKENWEDN